MPSRPSIPSPASRPLSLGSPTAHVQPDDEFNTISTIQTVESDDVSVTSEKQFASSLITRTISMSSYDMSLFDSLASKKQQWASSQSASTITDNLLTSAKQQPIDSTLQCERDNIENNHIAITQDTTDNHDDHERIPPSRQLQLHTTAPRLNAASLFTAARVAALLQVSV